MLRDSDGRTISFGALSTCEMGNVNGRCTMKSQFAGGELAAVNASSSMFAACNEIPAS